MVVNNSDSKEVVVVARNTQVEEVSKLEVALPPQADNEHGEPRSGGAKISRPGKCQFSSRLPQPWTFLFPWLEPLHRLEEVFSFVVPFFGRGPLPFMFYNCCYFLTQTVYLHLNIGWNPSNIHSVNKTLMHIYY
jgi:hypothetical protein